MFHVGITGLGQNGFMNMVMTSHEKTNAVLMDFDIILSTLGQACTPQEILAEALKINKVNENDLTYFDKCRLERKVEAVQNGGIYNE